MNYSVQDHSCATLNLLLAGTLYIAPPNRLGESGNPVLQLDYIIIYGDGATPKAAVVINGKTALRQMWVRIPPARPNGGATEKSTAIF